MNISLTLLRRFALLAGVSAVLWLPGPHASAAEAPDTQRAPGVPWLGRLQDRHRPRPGILALTPGSYEIGYAVGAGVGLPVLGSHSSDALALGSLRIGRVLSRQWEVSLDVWGGERVTSGTRPLAGLTPAARYRFAASGNLLPFVSLGTGPSYADLRGPDLSTLFEFNTQLGVGAYYFVRDDTAVTLELRFVHLSNAGMKAPNGGTNTQMAFIGISRFY